MKRIFDIVGALLGLVLLLPLGVAVSVLIAFTDGVPIFYRQTRIGQFGRPFRLWKFRTMVKDADKKGLYITKGRDERITPVGGWLRKTKMDELPQLWNVLRGEMSFVGPRPEVPKYVALYTAEQGSILEQRPGITDLASLLFREEESLLSGAPDVEQLYIRYCLPKKIQLNREYAARATVLTDIGTIIRTVWVLARDTCWKVGGFISGAIGSPAADGKAAGSGVAIVGSGDLARATARRLLADPTKDRRIVAFFDDDPRRWQRRIFSIPVAGIPECILNREWLARIDEVIVTLPSFSPHRLEELRSLLHGSRLRVSFIEESGTQKGAGVASQPAKGIL